LEGGAKIATFFHLSKEQGISPFLAGKKSYFATSIFSQKVAFLIGTYLSFSPTKYRITTEDLLCLPNVKKTVFFMVRHFVLWLIYVFG